MRKWNVGPTAVKGTPQPSCLEEVLGKEWKAEAWKVYLANMVMNASLAFMGLCTITYFLFLTDYNFYYYWTAPMLAACFSALPFALKYGSDEMELRLLSQAKRSLEKNWINSELEKINKGRN
jgi:hypothetical protein